MKVKPPAEPTRIGVLEIVGAIVSMVTTRASEWLLSSPTPFFVVAVTLYSSSAIDAVVTVAFPPESTIAMPTGTAEPPLVGAV